MIILIKLILAHLVGDFFLQSDGLIKEKREKKFRSPGLYLHALVHGVLSMAVLWDTHFWRPALIIVITHALIDGLKVSLQNEKNDRAIFLVDQLLHLMVIGLLWYYWVGYTFPTDPGFPDTWIIYFTAIVFITFPTSTLIKIVISKWTPDPNDKENESLQHAGKYIGILERLFVFAFVLTGHWEAVGFLIAAKSVFRFGDLKESRDLKLTEYILIGTLLSFGIAIFTGLATLKLIELVNTGY